MKVELTLNFTVPEFALLKNRATNAMIHGLNKSSHGPAKLCFRIVLVLQFGVEQSLETMGMFHSGLLNRGLPTRGSPASLNLHNRDAVSHG